ncbi:MAG TPA: glycosyltransferase family 4 protein [Thermoanaerobaculia bacterium]|nr:glycosyltransferase family 4 protein [Thermoanaerobaculia bacterium]
MNRPKILFAATVAEDTLGGVELWCGRTAARLRDRGYDTAILASTYGGEGDHIAAESLRALYTSYGIDTTELPIIGLSRRGRPPGRAAQARIAAFFADQLPDSDDLVILPNESETAWLCCAGAAWLRRPHRVASIVHTDATYAYDVLVANRWLVPTAAAVSTRIRDRIREVSGGTIEAELLPYGVPTRPAMPLEPRPTRGPLRLGFAGRLLDQHKGILVLPEIVAELRGRGVPSEMWVAGEGPDRGRLGARVEELGVGEEFRFFGALAHGDILRMLASIELLLMPSHREGISIVLLEAMAQGAVPVTTNVSGARDAIVSHEVGIVVEERSPSAFATACATLAKDRHRLARMSKAARSRAVEAYSEDTYADRLLSFLEEVLNHPRPSWPRARLPGGAKAGLSHRFLPEPLGGFVRRLVSEIAR